MDGRRSERTFPVVDRGIGSFLVVEDDPEIRDDYRRWLEDSGFATTVGIAMNRREALQHANREKYDVVIFDIQLGETEESALFRDIKNIQPHTEIIVITGKFPSKADVYLRMGASDFVVKPIEKSEFIERARISVGRSKDRMTGLLVNEKARRESGAGIIYSKREFERYLKLLCNSDVKFTLVVFDIDDLKGFNDSFGHDIGDSLLNLVMCEARRICGWEIIDDYSNDLLNSYIGESCNDTKLLECKPMPFRCGGDEFSIVLPDQGYSVEELIGELSVSVRENAVDSLPASPGLSFGVATREMVECNRRLGESNSLMNCLGVEYDSWDLHNCIVRAADSCLYIAKRSGKNTAVYFSKMTSNEFFVKNVLSISLVLIQTTRQIDMVNPILLRADVARKIDTEDQEIEIVVSSIELTIEKRGERYAILKIVDQAWWGCLNVGDRVVSVEYSCD